MRSAVLTHLPTLPNEYAYMAVSSVGTAPAIPLSMTRTDFALLALAAADQAGATARQFDAIRAALEAINGVDDLAEAAHWVRMGASPPEGR